MTDADSSGRQEEQSAGSSASASASAVGRRRSSMNDAVNNSAAKAGAAASAAAAAAATNGRQGRRSSYTNRRSSFGTKIVPPPPGSAVSATATAAANRRASQDSAISSSSYNRRGSQTSHNSQGRIEMLREEIAQLKDAADRELKEREGDIHALRVEKAGYEEKQKEMETEMHERAERKHLQEAEEIEEAERKASRQQQLQKGRRGSGLLQRRPSLNSLGSWGAMAKLEQHDDSSSDDEEGAATKLSRRSSSASLAALFVLHESLNGVELNAPGGAYDEPPRNIEVAPRRASLHESLVNLGGGVQREQMRRRPSLSSLVGWAKEGQEVILVDDAVGTAAAEDNQSFGRMSRRNSFGSMSAMSMGLSSADFEGESSEEEEDDGESSDQTMTSDDKTPSVGRRGGMHKASSMRSVASNLDIESLRSKLQRRSSERGVTSSNVATLASLANFDSIKNSSAGCRRSIVEGVTLSSIRGSGGLSRVRSASALSALADMLDNDSDDDECDHSIGAHSAGPLLGFAGRRDGGNERKQGKGKMNRRPSFGGLGGALANLGIGGIGGGDDERSVGGHSLGAMAMATTHRAQRRPSLGSLTLFGHAKASWSKEQADQLIKERGRGSMKRSSSFSALSRMGSGDSDIDECDRSIGAHSLGPFMLAADPRRSGETGRGQMKRRPSLGALGIFGQGNWSKEQADKMVEESSKEKMQRERAERIKRDREDRQKRYDEQMNQLKSSLGAADIRKEELQQANKEQEEQIALLRLQVRAAKAKRECKKSAKRSTGADNSEVDPKEQQRQLDEALERITKGRASWAAMSEKLDEADANVDSLETIVRRMRRKASEVLLQQTSAGTSSLVAPTSLGDTEILWNTVPELPVIAVPVWDRVVRERDTERTRAKARHRIIATCSYRLAKDLNKSVVKGTPSEINGKDLDEASRYTADKKGIAEGVTGFSQSLNTSASSLEQDTSLTKLALASTQTARSIAEKMILRDIALFNITKSILSLCQSVTLSSSENGDVRSRLLSDYISFRCDRSGLAISSKLQERLEVLRCRGDDRDRTLRSLERKKEQMEAKAKSLQQSIDEMTIDIIERKQYFMLGIQRVSKMSEPMQKTLLMQQLQIKVLTYDVNECDKKIRALESEIDQVKRTRSTKK